MTDRDLRERLIEAAKHGDETWVLGQAEFRLYAFLDPSRLTAIVDAVLSALPRLTAEDELRQAAWWVVMNWDTEQSQHHSMPVLRRALGLPGERPTREEAQARLMEYLHDPAVKPWLQHGAILPERVTDEMVERASEALWTVVATKDLGHQRPYPYDRLIPATQRDLADYARAALEAALTPSQPPAGEVRADSDNPSESERR